MNRTWAEVHVEFLSTAGGGRSTALDLCNDHPGTYKAVFRMARSGATIPVAFMDGPDEPVAPGGSTFADVVCECDTVLSDSELVEGARFDVLEDDRIVGSGVVTRR